MTPRRIILKQQSLSASENRDALKHLTFNLLCILLQEANKQLTIQYRNKSGRSLAYKYSRLSSGLSPLETVRFAGRETPRRETKKRPRNFPSGEEREEIAVLARRLVDLIPGCLRQLESLSPI